MAGLSAPQKVAVSNSTTGPRALENACGQRGYQTVHRISNVGTTSPVNQWF